MWNDYLTSNELETRDDWMYRFAAGNQWAATELCNCWARLCLRQNLI